MTDPTTPRTPAGGEDAAERLARLEARVADLEQLRAQAAADADAWRESTDHQHENAASLERELDATRRALHETRRELGSTRADLDRARADLDRARAEIASMRASRSWQITAPLRSAAARWRSAGTGPVPIPAAQPADPQRAETIRRLAESGLFDCEFYLRRYPDIVETGADPLEHFVDHGAAEGRDPNPFFATAWYLERNGDLVRTGENPLLHYLDEGARQGRDPGARFSGSRYLELYPDVAAAGLNPLAHFLAHGRAEGRIAPPSATAFDAPGVRDPLPRLAAASAASSAGGASILVVDAQVPTPDRDSGSVRMLALTELIVELGWRVTFVAHQESSQPGYDDRLAGLGVTIVHGAAAARQHLRDEGGRYRLAVLSRPPMAEMYLAMVRTYALRAEVVYDSVDLHWVRHRRAFELSRDPEEARLAEHFRRLESFAIACSDRVLAITAEEQRTIEEHWPGTQVRVLPNVHDVRPLATPFHDRSGMVFIGNYAHPPNVDAMTWFVGEVLPRVVRELPGARLRILGVNAPESLRALASPSVDVTGWVEDAEPYFAAARVFVSPLRYGAGMKGKVGQAMSLGTPVVTTRIGAEGMDLVDGVHALVADDPAALAAAIVRLHGDAGLWESLRAAAAAHVERHFSRAAARRELVELLAGAAGGAPRERGEPP